MKKILIFLLILSWSSGFALAQSPTPSPAAALPTPSPSAAPASVAAMKLPPQTQSAFLAGQIIQQVTTMLNQVIQVIDNGVPAQGDLAGISAKDLQAALGSENVMRLRSAVAILSGGPAPAASPQPKN